MAEKDSTTETPIAERETSFNHLSDLIALTFVPLEDFVRLIDDSCPEGDTGRIMRVIRKLLDKQQEELKEIDEAIVRTLGYIRLEMPLWEMVVEFEGRKFEYPQLIRAVLEPVKAQAGSPEGGES
jgi:hypothetical protein